MTPDQLKWASKQFWFVRLGEDADGMFVVGRDSYGSRAALVFRSFERLADWSDQQRTEEKQNEQEY